MQEIVQFLVDNIGSLGYGGIFILMFLESSFFPFPSEVVMIPAGYLAYKGSMNIYLAVLAGILGSYFGAIFNYFLAHRLGRKLLIKYGAYLFIKPETLEKLEKFFETHGHISTFTGRLLPGIRQYISLPAGLAKMPLGIFSVYTIAGAGLWVSILAVLGYVIGGNEALIVKYLHSITLVMVVLVGALIAAYYVNYKRKQAK
ncbi:MAG: DedA family protein [archaeon]